MLFGDRSAAQGVRPVMQPPPNTDNLGAGSIRGRVVMPNGGLLNQSCKVTLQTLRGIQSISYTDNQGQFEFRGLNPDNYRVEVEADQQQFEVSSESVQVLKGTPSIVTISLKEKKRSADGPRPGGSTVSVAELDPNVPAQARTEFDRASKAYKEGKVDNAIAHLRKAIALYPRYLMAHNDLGAQLLEQGKLDEAAEELRQAIRIDAKAFNPQLNLGIVLVQQHDFLEAAETLRTALSLNPDSPAARLNAGLAAMGLNDFDSAEKEFKTAYKLGGLPYAPALFHLGNLYLEKGERELALKAFEAYLHDVPDAANAAQVQKLIGMLR